MHTPVKSNVLQQKISTKKLKPGLVAFYDIQPGNGADSYSAKMKNCIKGTLQPGARITLATDSRHDSSNAHMSQKSNGASRKDEGSW